jgi:hypothetical protein
MGGKTVGAKTWIVFTNLVLIMIMLLVTKMLPVTVTVIIV